MGEWASQLFLLHAQLLHRRLLSLETQTAFCLVHVDTCVHGYNENTKYMCKYGMGKMFNQTIIDDGCKSRSDLKQHYVCIDPVDLWLSILTLLS